MTEPEVRYCMTADGVRIAYTVTGEGPPILWCVDQLISHVQLEWSNPLGSRQLGELSRRNTLVRFDFRGCGLSDRVMGKSVDEYVLDIEAVVERTGLERFSVYALQTAAPFAIAYAARHPMKIDRMVIADGFARYRDLLSTPQAQALLAAAKTDWGMATEVIGYVAFGSGRDENKVHGEYVRACVGPDYFDYADYSLSFDVTEQVAAIRAPTLILRRSDIQFVTMEMTKDLAARIPDAQLVIIEGMGADHVEETVRTVRAFLNGETLEAPRSVRAAVSPDGHTGTAIILFADIVDSTPLTERLGDATFREKSRSLDITLRRAIRDHGGTPIDGKLVGDGLLAVFTSARQAIEAALACAKASGELSLHLGIHAGDVIREDNNVYGGAVNIAARISGLSAPGEVLVSDTVRSLARTSAGVEFVDRGEQSLKGIAEPVRVFAVRQA